MTIRRSGVGLLGGRNGRRHEARSVFAKILA